MLMHLERLKLLRPTVKYRRLRGGNYGRNKNLTYIKRLQANTRKTDVLDLSLIQELRHEAIN